MIIQPNKQSLLVMLLPDEGKMTAVATDEKLFMMVYFDFVAKRAKIMKKLAPPFY